MGYRTDGYGYGVKDLFLYDTAVPGNSNRGHEGKAYGTELPAADKDAIVEYMKRYDNRRTRQRQHLDPAPYIFWYGLAFS